MVDGSFGCLGMVSQAGYGAGLVVGGGDGFMDKIAAVNAQNVAIREERELLGKSTGGLSSLTKVPRATMEAKGAVVGRLLELEGCISVANVLSPASCDALLDYINSLVEESKQLVSSNKVSFDSRFGGVNCRGLKDRFGSRQDLFLPMNAPVVKASMQEALKSILPLLVPTVGQNALLHEVSSVVSDPGAPRQCVHADTIVLPCPSYPSASMEPLYTCFIALQDVEDDMGHTEFLPRTHTPEVHLLWNLPTQTAKDRLLSTNKVVKSGLKKGDVSIFDSRVLHCGQANTSNKRRVLAYFTISKQHKWPLPNGLHGSNSIRSEDFGKWTLDSIVTTTEEAHNVE